MGHTSRTESEAPEAPEAAAPPAPAKVPRDRLEVRLRVHTLVLLAVTFGAIWLSWRMTLPFLPALTLAGTLAILAAPLDRWLDSRLKRPSLASALSVLVVAAIVVVPAVLVAQRLFVEAASGVAALQGMFKEGSWQEALSGHPRLTAIAVAVTDYADLSGGLEAAAGWLTQNGAALVRGSVMQLAGLVLTFYLLFYALRDRAEALAFLSGLSPLSRAEWRELCRRSADTVHATIYGTLVVAAVQGVLGGLMFWVLGLPAALLWGVVMGLLAIVPVLGAFVVWIPAALFLAANGSWEKAIVLALWGGIVVSTIDNLLYPMLVGKKLRMHTVPTFIAIVGGLMVFGATGVILGPLVLTATALLLDVCNKRLAR
jgi:predicted PurR-regulated permease PerM